MEALPLHLGLTLHRKPVDALMICPKCSKSIPDDAALCCYCGRVFQRKKPTRKRGNGHGYVFKRGQTWSVRVTVGWEERPNGCPPLQKYRTKGGFRTQAEAMAAVPVLLEGTVKDKAPALAHYWEVYASDLEKLSDSKRTAYRIAWKRLAPIAHRRVDSLTVSDLRGVVAAAASTYYPARDCKNLLSHLFRLAGADGWVSKDLPSYIILPDLHEKEREPFTPEEQAALWKCYESGNKDTALPLLMIYSGMMPGEVMRLTPEKIYLEDRQILGAGLKTKVRKESPVWLPDAILPVLEDALADKDSPLWIRSEGAFYSHYYAALEAAGCRRLEPYSCRHTTATALAITENIAPQTIKKIMRWSSTRMLDRYAHPDEDAIFSAINK